MIIDVPLLIMVILMCSFLIWRTIVLDKKFEEMKFTLVSNPESEVKE